MKKLILLLLSAVVMLALAGTEVSFAQTPARLAPSVNTPPPAAGYFGANAHALASPICHTAFVKRAIKFKQSNVRHTHRVIFKWCVDGKRGWSIPERIKDSVHTLNNTFFKCTSFHELVTKTYLSDYRGFQLKKKNTVPCESSHSRLIHTVKINTNKRLYWGKHNYPLAKTYIQIGHLDATHNQYKWINQRLNPYLTMREG